MKKRIRKHIDQQHFVKVYLDDYNGSSMIHFEGIIFEQNEKLIFMGDIRGFNYDGFVVFRKSDISEIKRTENEIFFDSIIEREKIKSNLIDRKNELNFELSDFPEMLESIQKKELPIIVERLNNGENIFQIGPINRVEKKVIYRLHQCSW